MIKLRFLVFFHGCGEASGRRQIAGSEDCQCPDFNVCYTDTVMERRGGGLLRFEKNFFVMLIIVEIQYAMISILLCYSRN